jgi:hypothetical protein
LGTARCFGVHFVRVEAACVYFLQLRSSPIGVGTCMELWRLCKDVWLRLSCRDGLWCKVVVCGCL